MLELDKVIILGIIPKPSDTYSWSQGKLFPVTEFHGKSEDEVWDMAEKHTSQNFVFDDEGGLMYPKWVELHSKPRFVTGKGNQFLSLMAQRNIIAMFKENRRN